ncbi:MAG: GNAT family N-acetyltransferase [Pseudomonadota bacterium]
MKDYPDILDNPVWWSLSTRHNHLAEAHGNALALPEDLGPFAASRGTHVTDLADLAMLAQRRLTPALLMSRHVPAGLEAQPFTHGVQMVADCVPECQLDLNIAKLTEDDADQIFALARRTRPGPFERRTHMLGDFIGIKQEGVLVAMAGQRMKLPGFTEISAVCVDRGHRGRGLGAALVSQMAKRIIERGDWPFLHTYADNKRAISLYEKLGFRLRTGVKLVHLSSDVISSMPSHAFPREQRVRETTDG